MSLVQPSQKSLYLLRDRALRAKRHLTSLLYFSISLSTKHLSIRTRRGCVPCTSLRRELAAPSTARALGKRVGWLVWFSVSSVTALSERVQGRGGLWLCGAWNAVRIPLQESGVMIAVDIVRRLVGRDDLQGGHFSHVETDHRRHHLLCNHTTVASEELYRYNLNSALGAGTLMSLVVPTAPLAFIHRRH